MPTDQELVAQIRAQTLALIAEITAGPKPTYQVDGQMIAWGAYLQQLQDTVAWCDTQLAAAAPVEIRTQAVT